MMEELQQKDWNEELLVRLVTQAREGDNSAATELIRHYDKKLFFIARSYAKNDYDAKDIVQNVWIKALKNLSSLEDETKFEAWLAMIARNESISFVTSAAQKNSTMFSDLDNTEDGLVYDVADERISSRPDLVYSDEARREIILNILDTLPENQRLVTTMYFYDHMSLKDIAEELGVPMSTVTGRFQHAKNAIKQAVSDLQNKEGIKLYGMAPLPYFIYLMQVEFGSGWLPSTIHTLSTCPAAIHATAPELAQILCTAGNTNLLNTAVNTAATVSTHAQEISSKAGGTAVTAGAAAKAISAVTAASEETAAIAAETVIGNTTAVTAETIAAASAETTAAASASATTAGAGAAASTVLSAPSAAATAGVTVGKIVAPIVVVTVIGTGAVVLPGVIASLTQPKEVNIYEYINVSFGGYNGYGSGAVSFRDTGDAALNELLNSGTCLFNDDGHYVNGLPASVSCTFDAAAAEEAGYIMHDYSGDYIVEGLQTLIDLDLFEGVSVEWATDEEEHTAEMVLNEPADPEGIEIDRVIISQDDNGNAIVHAYVSNEEMLEKGFQALGGIYDKKFSLGRIPDTYQDLRKACTAGGGIWDGENHSCQERPRQVVQAETQPVQQDNGIMGLAQSYVGRTGLCDHIAWQFIWDLYGVDITGYQNTYAVGDLQPGDLVLYYDDAGTWRHVSTYLGNGMVLAGNYLDGTAHIVGINQSYYTTKSFLRVAR